jgi:hypothetical protein
MVSPFSLFPKKSVYLTLIQTTTASGSILPYGGVEAMPLLIACSPILKTQPLN